MSAPSPDSTPAKNAMPSIAQQNSALVAVTDAASPSNPSVRLTEFVNAKNTNMKYAGANRPSSSACGANGAYTVEPTLGS